MCRSPPPKSPDDDIREQGEEEDPFKRRKKALVVSAVKIERHFYDDVYFFANTRNPERLVLSLLYTVQLFSPNLIYMRRFEIPHSSIHPPPGSGTGGFECRPRSACGSSTRCPSPPPPRGLRSTGRPPNMITKIGHLEAQKNKAAKSPILRQVTRREKSRLPVL